ncbi:tetrapyrrole methylase family protein / MazG family protein [Pelagirhabdus alkalitolerans]|uniref:Tetrapyrrole methylase family protein / MazG family protein n=1 Tax=Pelagirhabdus alkalitolerans TaxID=1612202 RepID=A0A1G6MJ83_9BACI|nr:nucleoside triphosphate pyrophosphohydrolase [Pelagirhabdus alkalitolerans]SDC55354.1 tetrapyrrole methylase family protein / MazG family protein [Pelagirhabdus alkalitolerans]
MSQIDVIGLGAGEIDQLSLGLYRQLTKTSAKIYARTADHPVLETLKQEGVTFETFDDFYRQFDSFESVYQAIAKELVELAHQQESIIYVVPGHPMLAERTVQLLLESELTVDIKGGQSYLDDLFTSLKIDPIEGFQFLDATSFSRDLIDYTHHLIFCQVYDTQSASELKLELLEDLDPNHPVTIVEAAGTKTESIETVPLVELDRTVTLSNLTSVYVQPATPDELNHRFFRLKQVIHDLRAPGGCPWDRAQTHESLRHHLIDEAYELIDAINEEDDEGIVEELGDVLLQVMLHSQIGEDAGYFTVEDVTKAVTDKMIRRHPHVFGDVKVDTEEELHANWNRIKATEKNHQTDHSRLDRVPESAHGLVRSQSIQKEAAKVGFDHPSEEAYFNKLLEEMEEIKEVRIHSAHQLEEEIGDLLFAAVNLARFYKVNSDLALRGANDKFERRFRYIEKAISDRGNSVDTTSLEEMDRLWEECKKQEESEENETR